MALWVILMNREKPSGIMTTNAHHPILGHKYFCFDCFDAGKGPTWTYFPNLHRMLHDTGSENGGKNEQ